MTPYLISQIVGAAAIVLVGFLALWRYRVLVGNPAQVESFRYRFFALRDRAIRLVAEGVVAENDPVWQCIYQLLNETARTVNVSRMKNGLFFVLHLLRHQLPPDTKTTPLDEISPPLRELLLDHAKTVLRICWEGSLMLRMVIRLATKYQVFREWLKRQRPREATSYIRWRDFGRTLSPTP